MPNPYGVNAHIARDVMLEAIRAAGVGWIRIDVDWDAVEPTEGQRTWNEVDRVIAAANALGLSVLASVAYAPSWATHDGRRTGAPRDSGRWQSFLTDFLQRQGEHLAAVSIGNEPNLRQFFTGTKQQYLEDVLAVGLETARAVAPGVRRCGPDLSSSRKGGDPLTTWLRPILDGPGIHLDVITHHQYDGGDTPEGRASEIDRLHSFLMDRRDTRELWITETGWDTRSGISAEVQASNLRGVMRTMRKRPWWAKTFWYDSHGPGWGLFEPDTSPRRGDPRPALDAYAADIATGDEAGQGPALGAEDARVVVQHAYRGILGREPDPAGLAAYASELERGWPITRVCRHLFESAEFRASRSLRSPEALVSELYLGILEREPDPSGRTATLAAVVGGQLADRAAAMLQDQEFQLRFLSGTPEG